MSSSSTQPSAVPSVNNFRALTDPEKVFYAPPLPAVVFNSFTLLSTLALVLMADYTPAILFLVAPSHLLACMIGFREPQASNLFIGWINAGQLPSELLP